MQAGLMLLWGIICGAYALLILSQAKSAIHEIEAGVALIVATISVGFAFVLDSMRETRKKMQVLASRQDSTPSPTPSP